MMRARQPIPSTAPIATGPSHLGTQVFRYAIALVLLVAVGLAVAVAVDSPSKRLIEALAGGVFLLVALALHISISLAVLLALLPFPAGTHYGTSSEILIFVLLIVFAVKQLIRGRPVFRRTPIDLPVVLIIGVTLISLVRQEGDLRVVGRHIQAFFSAIALYYLIVSSCHTEAHGRRLLVGYVIGIAGSCIVATIQMFYPGKTLIPEFIYVPPESQYEKFVRAAGTFHNYSTFGQYMALNMILLSYLFIKSRSPYAKTIFMGLLVMASATFMSAAMRGALFAMAGGMIYLAVSAKGEVSLRHVLTMFVILAVLMSVLGSMMIAYTGTGYLLERLEGFSPTRGSSVPRVQTNLFFLERWLEHPIVGHGPIINLDLGLGGARTNNPHNQYLYYLYTIGLVGTAGFVWMLWRLYSLSLRAIRRPHRWSPAVQGIVTVFHTMLVVFAVHELFDDYMKTRLYQQIIWSMFAILVVFSRFILEPEVGQEEGRLGESPRLQGRLGLHQR